MTDKHLTEENFQVYITDPGLLSDTERAHVDGCSHCQQHIDVYRQVINAIVDQPLFSFDIDLSAAVPESIQPEKESRFRILLIPILIGVIVIVPLYLFRRNFAYFFSGLSDVFIMICALLFCCTLAVKAIQLYNNYRKQLDKINFLQ
ncbi:MAG: hypothetical protein QM764_21890 [Chitinophagaceae bacterium]